MASTEKEINIFLLDELEIIEETLKRLQQEDVEKATEYLNTKKHYIELKLYQKPPLAEEK